MSNYYLDFIENDQGDLVDIDYYHSWCASVELRAKGEWPCPSWPDYDVYCDGCGELIHAFPDSDGTFTEDDQGNWYRVAETGPDQGSG